MYTIRLASSRSVASFVVVKAPKYMLLAQQNYFIWFRQIASLATFQSPTFLTSKTANDSVASPTGDTNQINNKCACLWTWLKRLFPFSRGCFFASWAEWQMKLSRKLCCAHFFHSFATNFITFDMPIKRNDNLLWKFIRLSSFHASSIEMETRWEEGKNI